MILQRIPVGPLQVNCFIVGCPQTREAAIIDPGDEGERILDALRRLELTATLIINTHGHFDHIGANRLLAERTGAALLIHRADLPLLEQAARHAAMYGLQVTDSVAPTRLLEGGETLALGSLSIRVLPTPGHSPGGISLLVDGHVFTGDALFAGSIGRTDLPGSNTEQLLAAIREQLLSLPEQTVVHPGHGPDTSIGREKLSNPFF
ncbi:MBL fold metallo-hydrolase [Geoalkalibacter sp.]|uniref:MBL fold metallo-hydrolase n=1 Tax=Geoalkalibacter sp. TaxID=3041440 RepID=UPI00272E805D|nr:MBL fold metallo-hydrolase [Geoalkalibacter sp.]